MSKGARPGLQLWCVFRSAAARGVRHSLPRDARPAELPPRCTASNLCHHAAATGSHPCAVGVSGPRAVYGYYERSKVPVSLSERLISTHGYGVLGSGGVDYLLVLDFCGGSKSVRSGVDAFRNRSVVRNSPLRVGYISCDSDEDPRLKTRPDLKVCGASGAWLRVDALPVPTRGVALLAV